MNKIVIKPGAILCLVILKITAQSALNCERCRGRIAQMNQWGIWGCWRKRGTITEWIVDEARRRGHEITEAVALSLFRSVLKEMHR